MRKLVAAMVVVSFVAACSESSGPNGGSPAALLILSGGTLQAGVFGEPAPVRPTVLVVDSDNLPVSGVTVSFAVAARSGTISSPTQTTSSKGSASVEWTMGNGFGAQTLTANVQGLEPVTFTATAIAPNAGVIAFNLVDPAGDTLSAPAGALSRAVDLIGLRGDFKRDSLIVTATFTGPVLPGFPPTGSVAGFVEFDIDDSPATGDGSTSNFFGASASVGIEYWLGFFSPNGTRVGLYGLERDTDVAATFSGNTIVARIPMSKLANDDGNFTVVGVVGPTERPTDIFPNSGQTQIRRSVVSSSYSSNFLSDRALLSAATTPRFWNTRR